MKIAITKKQNRNRIVCTRADGTFSAADLGPNLPHHDLAHFVVETTLKLHDGFFGSIARGLSFEQLGDKQVIKSLPRESWWAEVLAGALGSLATGACTTEQFPELVNGGLARFGYDTANTPGPEQTGAMLSKLSVLLEHWTRLGDGETLELVFNP